MHRRERHHCRRSIITEPRVNSDIRISPIRLIGAEGDQLGVVSLEKARQQAAEAELDLVEVAPQARPPVVRLMDYGKYLYDRQKKAKQAKKNAHATKVKQVQLRPRTEQHDFDVVLKRARKFLEQGNLVRVVMRYRGRELRQADVGIATLDRLIEETSDVARVDQRSRRVENRRLVALLEPAT